MRRIPRRYPILLILGSLLLLPLAEAGAQGLGYRAGVTQFGKNKVQWRYFDWQIYASPHFKVYYYPEEQQLLQKVVSFAESAYDSLSRAFDYQISTPTTLIFYSTHSAFEQNNIIVGFIPEGIGAFASPVRHRMVLPVDMPDPELMALIRHELTHIFQYHILFGAGTVGGVNPPPQWFMEGMASYMGKDETARDRMYLRDAVVNDAVPSISRAEVGGFLAYRFGHAVFDYIEERWGQDGFRDFVYEVRNTLGSEPGRALRRVFNVLPEDFDADFRRWLRRRYLPELVETGEPSDFGRRFRARADRQTQETSPAASPSGDLVAAFSTLRGDIDVVLFDTDERTLVRNLTRGYSSDFEYFVAQELSLARTMGRDLAFSPDGNRIALFARRGRGRDLVLVDALDKGVDRVIDLDVEQPFAPAWSPDGRIVAFSGFRNGQFDIFLLDLAAGTTRNLTNDAIYDGSPTFTPDGNAVIVSSVVGETTKLFRIDLSDPGTRHQLTDGEGNDVDAVVTPQGDRVFFTSDRTGAQNIFSLDLENGEIVQHTNVVTGCFQPTVLAPPDGPQRLVYTGYWRGRLDLYELRLEDPITAPEVVAEGSAEGFTPQPLGDAQLPEFEPPIEVALDDANKEDYRGGKFFLEDAGATAGITSDQILLGYTYLIFSDQLGDRRILALLSSVESFQDISVSYLNSRRRWQWGANVFDTRIFAAFRDPRDPFGFVRESEFEQRGAIGSVAYPFNVRHRFEAGLGYMQREQFFPFVNPETGELDSVEIRDDDFPIVQLGFVGDTAIGASWGPVAGRRWSIQAQYAPDLDDSGSLFRDVRLDWRQYVPLTMRSNLALRLYGAMSDGNAPNVYYFGGTNDFRGVRFNEFSGNRAFFSNIELRFPLIDRFATPILDFQGIRGRVFLDVGGAWFDDFDPRVDTDFDFWDSELDRLADGRAAYGFGFTVRFLGLDLNWDLAKQWDGEESISDTETSFYIGWQF
ncbi:MAG: hypothetical protein ACRD2Z_16585 [Thermoanaerobaculia bacterium]